MTPKRCVFITLLFAHYILINTQNELDPTVFDEDRSLNESSNESSVEPARPQAITEGAAPPNPNPPPSPPPPPPQQPPNPPPPAAAQPPASPPPPPPTPPPPPPPAPPAPPTPPPSPPTPPPSSPPPPPPPPPPAEPPVAPLQPVPQPEIVPQPVQVEIASNVTAPSKNTTLTPRTPSIRSSPLKPITPVSPHNEETQSQNIKSSSKSNSQVWNAAAILVAAVGVLCVTLGSIFCIRRKRGHQLADRVEAQQSAFNNLMDHPPKSQVFRLSRNPNKISKTRLSTQSELTSSSRDFATISKPMTFEDPESISYTENLHNSYSYTSRNPSSPALSVRDTLKMSATSTMNISATSSRTSRTQNSEGLDSQTLNLESMFPSQSSLSGILSSEGFTDNLVREPELRISEKQRPQSAQLEFKDSILSVNAANEADPVETVQNPFFQSTSSGITSGNRDSGNSLNDSRVHSRDSWQSETSIFDQEFSELVRENSIFSESDRDTMISDTSDIDRDLSTFSLQSGQTGRSGASSEEYDLARLSECSEGEI